VTVSLATVAREWGRIGCIGFGGPPTHIALLRQLCIDQRRWMTPREFDDGIAACNLLPGPASTQLAILSAWRVAGPAGAVVGGVAFIVPGLIAILALAALVTVRALGFPRCFRSPGRLCPEHSVRLIFLQPLAALPKAASGRPEYTATSDPTANTVEYGFAPCITAHSAPYRPRKPLPFPHRCSSMASGISTSESRSTKQTITTRPTMG
jgi:hypothetical protein